MSKLRSNHFHINYFAQQNPLDHSSCNVLRPEALLTALFQALPKEKELGKGPEINKKKKTGKGASNRKQNPQPHDKTIHDSEDEGELGDVLFDNKYAKSSLEDIKISWNGASRGYGKAKKKFTGFIPHFSAPFNMEIAASMRELIENLTNFYRTLELTADAASIIYQHEVLSERLQPLEKDHTDMVTQLNKYVNSLSNVKLNSTLNQCLANQLVVDNLPHPVLAFKPIPLSKDSTPDEFAVWKDNFEVYFTASNAHNCNTKIQSVFLNTCLDKYLVSQMLWHIRRYTWTHTTVGTTFPNKVSRTYSLGRNIPFQTRRQNETFTVYFAYDPEDQ